MPTAVTDLPVRLDPPRKHWTRSEYDELSSSGSLNGLRLELIEGELIDKMGKKRPHVNSLTLLHGWLDGAFGVRLVNSAAPIDVAPEDNPTNEPEPDLIVLKRDLSHFTEWKPAPGRPPACGRGVGFHARFRPHHEGRPVRARRHHGILGAGCGRAPDDRPSRSTSGAIPLGCRLQRGRERGADGRPRVAPADRGCVRGVAADLFRSPQKLRHVADRQAGDEQPKAQADPFLREVLLEPRSAVAAGETARAKEKRLTSSRGAPRGRLRAPSGRAPRRMPNPPAR